MDRPIIVQDDARLARFFQRREHFARQIGGTSYQALSPIVRLAVDDVTEVDVGLVILPETD